MERYQFFDNNFTDDLGILTLGQQSSGHPNLMSPNSTLGGDLNKKWKIVNGERILLKTGSALFRQEVQNEVAATVLHQQLLEKEDYVPYFCTKKEGQRILHVKICLARTRNL